MHEYKACNHFAISWVIAPESVVSIISSNDVAQKFRAYFAFISLGILLEQIIRAEVSTSRMVSILSPLMAPSWMG